MPITSSRRQEMNLAFPDSRIELFTFLYNTINENIKRLENILDVIVPSTPLSIATEGKIKEIRKLSSEIEDYLC